MNNPGPPHGPRPETKVKMVKILQVIADFEHCAPLIRMTIRLIAAETPWGTSGCRSR